VPDHYREASPAEKHITAAQKLVHGTTDSDVPYELSKTYAERKKAAGEKVELITLPDTGHFDIVDPKSNVWGKVQDSIVALTRR
jgi:pimeloyl-ACP methyl ester carboxylesterase